MLAHSRANLANTAHFIRQASFGAVGGRPALRTGSLGATTPAGVVAWWILMTDSPQDDYTARARALVPEIRAQAERFEEDRQLAKEVVSNLAHADLLRLALPHAYGG